MIIDTLLNDFYTTDKIQYKEIILPACQRDIVGETNTILLIATKFSFGFD